MHPEVIKAVIFFFALNLSIYFVGRLATWLFVKPLSKKEILIANISMLIANVLWTILYYLSL